MISVPVLCALLLYQLIFFALYERTRKRKGSGRVLSTVFKCAVTLSDAALACVLCAKQPSACGMLICLALIADTAADYVINFRFVPGMLIFGLGHMLYCAAFLAGGTVGTVNLCVTLGLLALSGAAFALFQKKLLRRFPGQSAAPFAAYVGISCLLIGLSCTLPPTLAVGGILFVLSDLLLAIRIAMKIPGLPFECICMLTYYAAQLLIALGAAC